MTSAAQAAALLVAVAAVLAATVVLGRTRSMRQALPVFLDLLTAAALLRLSTAPGWAALVVTAVVILLRRLAPVGIRTASASRRATSPR